MLPSRKKSRRNEILGLLAFVGLWVAGIALWVKFNPSNSVATPVVRQFDRFNFITACRWAVEDQLRSPGTAEFVGIATDAIKVEGQRGTLKAEVDAENGFGAVIRSNFVCTGTEKDVSVELVSR